MDYCNVIYRGLPLKSYSEVSDSAEVMWDPKMSILTSLFHKLHWIPICFQVQFKMLVFNCKESEYLRDCLFPVTSTIPSSYEGGVCCRSHLLRSYICGTQVSCLFYCRPCHMKHNSLQDDVTPVPILTPSGSCEIIV